MIYCDRIARKDYQVKQVIDAIEKLEAIQKFEETPYSPSYPINRRNPKIVFVTP